MRIASFFTLLVTASLLHLPAAAQENILSAAVADAGWQRQDIAEGVELRTFQFTSLLGLPQFIAVLDIDLNTDLRIDVVSADSGRVTTSQLGLRYNALAAINGGYFESDGRPSHFLQDENGVVRLDDDNREHFSEEGAIATDADGDAEIVRRPLPIWQALPLFADVLVAGPLLVWSGEVVESETINFNLTHHPRTAAGLTANNHLILLTADGRDTQSAGLTIQELALLMQALGCRTALNLDGGGSTTMWIRGMGVVNHPSDNNVFDHDGERAVSNAVLIRSE